MSNRKCCIRHDAWNNSKFHAKICRYYEYKIFMNNLWSYKNWKKSVIDKMKHNHVNKWKPVIARILNIENLECIKLINESASNDYILYFKVN